MIATTYTKLNDPGLLRWREHHFTRLTSLFNGTLTDGPIRLNGIWAGSAIDPYTEPEHWVEDALHFLVEQADKITDPDAFHPLCLEFEPYGVHFIDKMFGAAVFFNENSQQWYNHCLPTPVGALTRPNLADNEIWLLAQRIAKAFVQQQVEVPLFGLPVIASALNIAVNLYGENILVALYNEPAAALHDLKLINDLLRDLHRWYLQHIPLQQLQPVVAAGRCQPRGHGQICGCTTQLLSPRLYQEFIAPLDDELLSVYPNGGMIHLCGAHIQHIPVWREMKSLRAVQINDRAAEDLEIYFRELRDDQVIYFSPCEGMPVERALEITKGHRLVIA